MARATYLCFACGNSIVISGRNRKEADRLADWHRRQEHTCQACQHKVTAEENRKSAEINRENGLPDLVGSPEQVTWAETLRYQRLNALDQLIEQANKNGDSYGELLQVNQRLSDYKSASWWINHRHYPTPMVIDKIKDLLKKMPKPDLNELEARVKSIVYPAVYHHDVPAEIALSSGTITVHYPLLIESVRLMLKEQLGFRWSGEYWAKTLSETDENEQDRVAEVGCLLLNLHVPILIWDAALREKAINADYEPLHTRWLTLLPNNIIGITWNRYSDSDYYKRASRLPTARWKKPYVAVKAEQVQEALGFAQEYDFKVTPDVLKLAETIESAKLQALIAEVSAPKERKTAHKPVLAEVDCGVDPDALDD